MREKLGLRDQLPNYPIYFMTLAYLPIDISIGPYAVVGLLASLFFVAHPTLSYFSNLKAQQYQLLNKFSSEYLPGLRISLPPHINPRDWKTACLPVVPVDKWVKGRRFLAKYGDELIIPRS